MNKIASAIKRIFKGAGKSFHRFPAAIVSALVISMVAIMEIRMDWQVRQDYSLLFTSIQLSFLLGAIFSMAAVALDEIRFEKEKSKSLLANLSGILLALVAFLLLYFLGGKTTIDGIYLSSIAMARISVAIFISGVAFVYLVSKAQMIDSFSDSFFINHRAFIISAIYGLVIMAGLSGVLGAFEALVYPAMNYRIYSYLGVIVGFVTYTIFLGYFPSFRGLEDKEEIEKIKEQPSFIYVLFEYILIPILMALTVVLLIWTLRVILSGLDVPFSQLSSIASSYVIIGIWLHIMVASHKSKLSKFYKQIYPFAGILILAFEAWALIVQVNRLGFTRTEYSFFMIWIFASISILLLLVLKKGAYRKMAITAVIISILWVLPVIGMEDITFSSQLNRLEEHLISEGLLVGENLIAKDTEIKQEKRGQITQAVDFISYSEKTNLPIWFTEGLNEEKIFKETFGFEKTYGVYEDFSEYYYANFVLDTNSIDISNYKLSINVLAYERKSDDIYFEGEDGTYEMTWLHGDSGVPKLTVSYEGDIIIEEDMQEYIGSLLTKYPPQEMGGRVKSLPFEEMSLVVEKEDISLLVVFSNIEAYYMEEGEPDYYLNPHGIYVKFN